MLAVMLFSRTYAFSNADRYSATWLSIIPMSCFYLLFSSCNLNKFESLLSLLFSLKRLVDTERLVGVLNPLVVPDFKGVGLRGRFVNVLLSGVVVGTTLFVGGFEIDKGCLFYRSAKVYSQRLL